MKTIFYYVKSVYGIDNRYIDAKRNEEMATLAYVINQLTNRKTLTDSDIHALRKLDYNFELVLETKK